MPSVDQLLFGYRDGHELIAGSMELDAAALQEIVPHTDASLDGEHEHQLVGTWIASAQRYLLCRIWPAPEQRRPGAVWAHGLLISGEDLRAGPLAGLRTLLRRPEQATDAYAHTLAWPADDGPISVPPRLGRALAEAVSARDQRPHIVLWRPPEDAQDALIALLNVMPAAHRAALSFRTRERVRAGSSPYRLQIAAGLRGEAAAGAPLVIDAREVPPGD
jgi:hypothetical protein